MSRRLLCTLILTRPPVPQVPASNPTFEVALLATLNDDFDAVDAAQTDLTTVMATAASSIDTASGVVAARAAYAVGQLAKVAPKGTAGLANADGSIRLVRADANSVRGYVIETVPSLLTPSPTS